MKRWGGLAVIVLAAVALRAEEGQLVPKIRAIVEPRAADGSFSGVVLVARGKDVLFEKAYGRGISLSTPFDIASVGKMFTGVAVAQLVERGRLGFDQPVGAYLPPALADTDIGRKVTIHHLLTHTSGVPDLPEDLFDDPPARLVDYTPWLAKQALAFEPGSQRAYSNSGYVLLGMIIERVSGRDYQRHMQEHLFRPAGMRVSFRRGDSRGGPHGGAWTTARDLLKFFRALRSGKLLKPETALAITTPRPGTAAAYGFGVLDFGTDRLVGHSGGNTGISADAYTYWNSGYSIVVLSNLGPPASHEVAKAIRKLIEPAG